MKRGSLILLGFLIVIILLAAGLCNFPSYQRKQQVRSGLKAVEFASELAFMQNVYREQMGTFTADFSQLAPLAEKDLDCELTSAPFSCYGYTYTLEQGYWLLAQDESDPGTYIAFDLLSGGADCSHAPPSVQEKHFCFALE